MNDTSNPTTNPVPARAARPVPMGPYQTEVEALAAPMPREVRALHDAGRVRSGDPDRLVRNTVLRHLLAACQAAGVEVGDRDRVTLTWLAGWEDVTAQVVIGLITRAHQGGRRHLAAECEAEADRLRAEFYATPAAKREPAAEAEQYRAGLRAAELIVLGDTAVMHVADDARTHLRPHGDDDPR